MAVTPSIRIAADAPAAYPQLWSLSSLFLAHWAESVDLSSAWLTDIRAARSAAEQRRSLVGKPYRSLRFTLLALREEEGWLLQNALMRTASARSLVPLYCDHTVLDSAAAGGAVTISCDTTYRRFFAGALVGLAQRDGVGAAFSKTHVGQILSLTASSITLSAALPEGFVKGSRVYPLIEADVELQGEVNVISGDKLQASFAVRETPGRSALDPVAAFNTIPAVTPAFPTYEGLPILTSDADWEADQSLGVYRDGREESVGKAQHFELSGDRPRSRLSRGVAALSRQSAWRILQFFDSRAGATLPFFLESELSPFLPTAVTTTTLTVRSSGPVEFWSWHPYVAIRPYGASSLIVRRIASFARAGNADTLTLADAIPAMALADLRDVRPAVRGRFASDQLVERWVTNETLRCQLDVVELLEEKSVTLNDVATIGDGSTKVAADPKSCEGSELPPPAGQLYRRARWLCGALRDTPSPYYVLESEVEFCDGVQFRLHDPITGHCLYILQADLPVDSIPEGGVLLEAWTIIQPGQEETLCPGCNLATPPGPGNCPECPCPCDDAGNCNTPNGWWVGAKECSTGYANPCGGGGVLWIPLSTFGLTAHPPTFGADIPFGPCDGSCGINCAYPAQGIVQDEDGVCYHVNPADYSVTQSPPETRAFTVRADCDTGTASVPGECCDSKCYEKMEPCGPEPGTGDFWTSICEPRPRCHVAEDGKIYVADGSGQKSRSPTGSIVAGEPGNCATCAGAAANCDDPASLPSTLLVEGTGFSECAAHWNTTFSATSANPGVDPWVGPVPPLTQSCGSPHTPTFTITCASPNVVLNYNVGCDYNINTGATHTNNTPLGSWPVPDGDPSSVCGPLNGTFAVS